MDGISDIEGKPHLAGQRTVYLYRVMQAYQEGRRIGETEQHRGYLNDEALLSLAAYYANQTPVRVAVIPQPSEQIEVSEQAQVPAQAAISKPVEASEEDPFLGIRGSMKRCIKCHGEAGNSSGSGMPNLTAQNPEYFVTSMQAYVDGSRSHKMMGKLVGKLDPAVIQEMAVFYAVQEPARTETQGEGDAEAGGRMTEDCGLCHGADGNASGSDIPTLAGQDARYFLKAMKAYKDGKRQSEDMVALAEDFDEEDFKDMATFYAVQEPLKRDVRTPLKSSEWIERCVRCHGIDGNSTDPRFPMLAGQDASYLKNTMQAFATGERRNSTMRAMAEPLSKLDIENIGSHFASQQPKSVVYLQLPCENDRSK